MRRLIIAIFAALFCFGQGAAQSPASEYVKFGWGASLTSSVDMTSSDMSSVGIDAYLGMKTAAVSILGFGTGINVPVSNSMRSIPVYFIARTSFVPRPALCFMDLRGGIAVNSLPRSDRHQTGGYGSVGLGIRLAASRKFQSHLIIGYSYYGRKPYEHETELINLKDLHMATIRLGVSF